MARTYRFADPDKSRTGHRHSYRSAGIAPNDAGKAVRVMRCDCGAVQYRAPRKGQRSVAA